MTHSVVSEPTGPYSATTAIGRGLEEAPVLRQGLQFNLRSIVCQKLAPSPQYGRVPLNEILIDFHDRIKSLTRGYGSMDYEHAGYAVSDMVKPWTVPG